MSSDIAFRVQVSKNIGVGHIKRLILLKHKLKINPIWIISGNKEIIEKVFKNKKIDYVMSSIIGIHGLLPTYKIIKYTKNIAIANKESIICGWKLIHKELTKNKTLFIPVDSEHFSLWYGLNNINVEKVEEFYLTASGGPLYKTSLKIFENLNKFNLKIINIYQSGNVIFAEIEIILANNEIINVLDKITFDDESKIIEIVAFKG